MPDRDTDSKADSLAHRQTRQRLAAVDRAMAELRRGAPVVVGDGAAAALVLAAETAEAEDLGRLLTLVPGGQASLALTTHRAVALGLVPGSRITGGRPDVCVVPVGPSTESGTDLIHRLADPTASPAAPAVHRLPLATVA